jgi:hydrogenase expression/formation protein HypE
MVEKKIPTMQGAVCPVPLNHEDVIIMGHGSGGSKTLNLIKNSFVSRFENPVLRAGNDAGVITIEGRTPATLSEKTRIAISTDSHVIYPLFFPGGDIGRLAVCGTVNDISMMGAVPHYLTAGFILEEGLPIQILEKIIDSMQEAANESGVEIIAGDTKVVQKGKGDQIYINTTGFGIIPEGINVSGAYAQPGDTILVSGSIGDHGIAVLESRGELGFQSSIRSDIAPLNSLVMDITRATPDVHTFRDPTRGGIATSLNEIAYQSNVGIEIDETCIPIKKQVLSACEMLGFDPLYIANEGKLIAIVPHDQAQKTLAVMQQNTHGQDAAIIGKVVDTHPGRVILKTQLGSSRLVDILSGELLPRIC